MVELLEVDSADGHPYLALEYVPGCDLWRLSRWLIREGRALGVELSVFVLLELLAGLEGRAKPSTGSGIPWASCTKTSALRTCCSPCTAT
ncbi:MAG: hypothetical protein R3B99_12415 [Polyangiales bacterium]